MRFHATLELGGKTATGIEVPEDVVEGLGSGRRPAVRITINGHMYRSTVAPRGGRFLLPVSAENRQHANIVAGDEVDVDIQLDDEPRQVTVPPDLSDALDADLEAKRSFEALPYSHQLQHVLAIEGAKTAETRQRRITKAVSMLREGSIQGR
jgi:hypothetical protein